MNATVSPTHLRTLGFSVPKKGTARRLMMLFERYDDLDTWFSNTAATTCTTVVNCDTAATATNTNTITMLGSTSIGTITNSGSVTLGSTAFYQDLRSIYSGTK